MKFFSRLILLILCITFLTGIGKLEPFVDVSQAAGIRATPQRRLAAV